MIIHYKIESRDTPFFNFTVQEKIDSYISDIIVSSNFHKMSDPIKFDVSQSIINGLNSKTQKYSVSVIHIEITSIEKGITNEEK